MKKVRKSLLSLVILFFIISLSVAQEKWSLELRPSTNFSTQDLADAQLKTGFGLEFTVSYNFMEHLGAYVGWGYNVFNSDNDSFTGTGDTDFDETGYSFGLQFIHPIGSSGKLSYLIRAGGVYNHIEVENDAVGDIIADSEHGLGWEVATGLQISLGDNWKLRPQVGYHALSRDIEIGSVTTVDLNYVAVGVGIAKLF